MRPAKAWVLGGFGVAALTAAVLFVARASCFVWQAAKANSDRATEMLLNAELFISFPGPSVETAWRLLPALARLLCAPRRLGRSRAHAGQLRLVEL